MRDFHETFMKSSGSIKHYSMLQCIVVFFKIFLSIYKLHSIITIIPRAGFIILIRNLFFCLHFVFVFFYICDCEKCLVN